MSDPQAEPRPAAPCQELPWDSEFFGLAIARVAAATLTADLCAAIDAWCAQHKTALLYFLGRSTDPDTPRLAARRGFDLVDLRLTLSRPATAPARPSPESIRPWQPDDLPELLRIAAGAYTDSRFYYDGRLPRARCDQLYQRWTELSCRGMAHAVLVARRDARVAGYVTCLIDAHEPIGSIGLLGVDSAHQGRGVGRELLAAALHFLAAHDLSEIRVVTQGRNVPAQRLYQQAGFVTRSLELYFHKWYPPA